MLTLDISVAVRKRSLVLSSTRFNIEIFSMFLTASDFNQIEMWPIRPSRQSSALWECKITQIVTQEWRGSRSNTSVVRASRKESSLMSLPSAVLQAHLNPWISARFHCVSQVQVNCEQKSEKENRRTRSEWDIHCRSCTVHLCYEEHRRGLNSWRNGTKGSYWRLH